MRADAAAAAEALFGSDGGAPAPAAQRMSRMSAAQRLAALAEGVLVFHAPDGRAYTTVAVAGHVETWPVRSKAFRGWLSRAYYEKTGRPGPAQAMTETLALVEARALAGAEHPVYLRVAEADGKVYVDLADEHWRVVEVDGDGWRVLDRAPTRFRRAAGMRALLEPKRGGTVDELREFVNVEDERAWRLLVAWLVMALSPRGPYPVLVLGGEHGAAKTWTANRLRDLVDPNEAPNRAEPREPRDLMIAARHGWVLAFDNISDLPAWLSDGLCRLATGSGFATRELYTDDDEVIFAATRPVIVNGIGEVVTRPDLLDRSILLSLPPITEDRRRDERQLLEAFAIVRPRILGALLDAVSAAVRHRDAVRLPRAPRLADFARWVTAAEPGLMWPAGGFMDAYDSNRADAHELALEASAIAPPVRALLAEVENWEGTASELLAALTARTDETVHRTRDWPSSARSLSGALRRLAPSLRAVGVNLDFNRETDTRRRRMIRLGLRKADNATVRTVHSVRAAERVPLRADGSDCSDDGILALKDDGVDL